MDTDPARDLILRAFLLRLVELYGPAVAVQFLERAAAALKQTADASRSRPSLTE
jgi:hypothetical protein